VLSDYATIDLHTTSHKVDDSASGFWSESFVKRPTAPWFLRHVAGMVLAIVPSSATVIPLFLERRQWDSSTVLNIFETRKRRYISLKEGRQIAMQFMVSMEEARRKTADNDAMDSLDEESSL
jgi:hypothetical protein